MSDNYKPKICKSAGFDGDSCTNFGFILLGCDAVQWWKSFRRFRGTYCLCLLAKSDDDGGEMTSHHFCPEEETRNLGSVVSVLSAINKVVGWTLIKPNPT